MHPKRNLCAPQQRRIRRHVQNSDAYTFLNLLTRPELLTEIAPLVPPHWERVFPPAETLSMFLTQTLSADRSCQKAVNNTAVKRLARGLPPCRVWVVRGRESFVETLTTLNSQTHLATMALRHVHGLSGHRI